jgi:uncharacterized membrane protein YccC
MMLLYWLALSLNWDLPKYGALAIALISLDTTGASVQKGAMRIIGTTFGLAVGMLGLALFAQDSWSTLLYHAVYLAAVGYFVQTSRYPYAWFVAGFLPSLVWATTYGNVGNVFHYAIFRYLETSAGIVIYALVSILFWPRQAGDQLYQQAAHHCAGLRDLFECYRRQAKDGGSPAEAAGLRNQLAGANAKMLSTILAACEDTPSVAARKHAWEAFQANVRAVGDAMELWRQSVEDCRHLNLDQELPQGRAGLAKLSQRLERINDLSRVLSARPETPDCNDNPLLEPLQPDAVSDSATRLSPVDRAALQGYVQQLNLLDGVTRKLLRTMRGLAGLDPIRTIRSQTVSKDLYRPPRWDPLQLLRGLMPAICFTTAYFFWIHWNPPTGPSVPNMAATFGLLVVMTGANALALLPLFLVAIWGFVAPAYFFVMPSLSTGLELLAFIFGFVLAVESLLVGRLSPLRSPILVMFVMMTGISNQQKYSFMGLVDGAMMILLAVTIIAVVQTVLSPLGPEQVLKRNLRRFFHGCARVMSQFALSDPAGQAKRRRLRKRFFDSLVLPTPAKIQAAQQRLDYRHHPENTPDDVQRLHDSVQSLVLRLQSLEITQERIEHRGGEAPESLVVAGKQIRETLERLFQRWSRFETGETIEDPDQMLRGISLRLKQEIELLTSDEPRERSRESQAVDLHTVLGNLRGLLESMADTQLAIKRIDWTRLSISRF